MSGQIFSSDSATGPSIAISGANASAISYKQIRHIRFAANAYGCGMNQNEKKRKVHAQTFRFPADVWQQLVMSAEGNLRSLNSELVWILREHFAREIGSEGKDGTALT
jgi:hypothetical protein